MDIRSGIRDRYENNQFIHRVLIIETVVLLLISIPLTYFVYYLIDLSGTPTFTIASAVISGSFVLYSLFMPRYFDELMEKHERLLQDIIEEEHGDIETGKESTREETETDEETETTETDEETETTETDEDEVVEETELHISTDLLSSHEIRSKLLLRSTVLTLLLLPVSVLSKVNDFPVVDAHAFIPLVDNSTLFAESMAISLVLLLWLMIGSLVLSEAMSYRTRTRDAIEHKEQAEGNQE